MKPDVLPPQDLEAEMSVIGSLLLDAGELPAVRALLRPEDMYSPDNAAILAALYEMADDAAPADVVTLSARLNAKGELERIGGPGLFFEAMERTPSAAHASAYARIVAEAARRRRVIAAAGEAERVAQDATADDAELCAAAEAVRVAAAPVASAFDLDAEADAAIRALEEPAGTAWATGLDWLDGVTGRLRQGQVWIIGGRSRHCKTALAIQVTRAVLDAGGKVAMFRYEESPKAVLWRLAGLYCGVPPSDLMVGIAPPGSPDRATFLAAVNNLRQFKGRLGIYGGAAAEKIEGVVSTERPDVAIYDTLQAMTQQLSKRTERRDLEIGQQCGLISHLAMRYGHAAVVLSQLKKEAVGLPTMNDLRESGAIEEAADVALLLWYPWVYLRDAAWSGRIVVNVGKNRPGGAFPVLAVELHAPTQEFRRAYGDAESAALIREAVSAVKDRVSR